MYNTNFFPSKYISFLVILKKTQNYMSLIQQNAIQPEKNDLGQYL